MALETGFLRESVGNNNVFSSKNPVSLVGCVSPVRESELSALSKKTSLPNSFR